MSLALLLQAVVQAFAVLGVAASFPRPFRCAIRNAGPARRRVRALAAGLLARARPRAAAMGRAVVGTVAHLYLMRARRAARRPSPAPADLVGGGRVAVPADPPPLYEI